MAREADAQPNFIIIDDEVSELTEEPVASEANDEEVDLHRHVFNLSDSEADLITKSRRKLRLFDPEGVYLFRTSKISYFHSFLHITSLVMSILLLFFYFFFYFTLRKENVPGLGEITDAALLEQLFMFGIVVLSLIKLKQIVTVKVTNFDIRYKLALVANSVNRILIDIFRFSMFLLAVETIFILVNYPEEKVVDAFYFLENGVFADTITFLSWVFTLLIFVRAYKRIGKE